MLEEFMQNEQHNFQSVKRNV